MKQTLLFFWEAAKIVILALLIVIPIRYFVFQPFLVKGVSMEPNFQDGDYLIIDEFSYRFRTPSRGEVVIFHYPEDPSQRFIKRIIGLPQETVEIKNGKITITDKFGNSVLLNEKKYIPNYSQEEEVRVFLRKDEYFVMGDNRNHSFDSRRWGALGEEGIIGRVVIRAWPLESAAMIIAPEY